MTDIERRCEYLEARCDRLEKTLKSLFRYVQPYEMQFLEDIDSAMTSAQRVLLEEL